MTSQTYGKSFLIFPGAYSTTTKNRTFHILVCLYSFFKYYTEYHTIKLLPYPLDKDHLRPWTQGYLTLNEHQHMVQPQRITTRISFDMWTQYLYDE